MSKSKAADPGQVELVEVVLGKAHIHKGKPRKAGDKINVTEAQKAWLEGRGVLGGKQEDVSND